MRKFLKTLKRSKLATSSVAFILAFSVLLSSFGGLTIFAGNSTVKSWTGEGEALTVGTGAQNDPFIITTGGQLYTAVTMGAESAGKYFELANDIYLNDVANSDWYTDTSAKQWAFAEGDSAGNYDATEAFVGNFDGKGHVIHGLLVDEKTAHTGTMWDPSVAAGLFPLLGGGATVTAVGIEDSYISVTSSCETENAVPAGYVGAIAGAIVGNADEDGKRVSISLSYADETTKLVGWRLGLVGMSLADNSAAGVSFTNCYATMGYTAYTNTTHNKYESGNRPSLMAGYVSNAVITSCWTTHNLYGHSGSASSSSANNYTCNWVDAATSYTSITAAQMKGTSADQYMPNLNWTNIWIVTSGYPRLRVFVDAVPAADDINVWDGTVATGLVGYGTETSPFLISNGEELAYFVKNGGVAGKYYKFTNDIYLNDPEAVNWETGLANSGYTPNEWYTSDDIAAPTAGIVNGNGKVVYGLYIKGEATTAPSGTVGAGLFPQYGNLKLTGIGVEKAYMEHYTNYSFAAIAGKISGEAGGNAVFDQCYVGREVNLKGYDVGAILGGGDPEGAIYLNNSYSLAKVSAGRKSGLVGNDWSHEHIIRDCYGIGVTATGNWKLTSDSYDVYLTNTSLGGSQITADAIKDTGASGAMAGLDFETVFITVDDDYPDLRIFGRHTAPATENDIWNGQTSKPTAGGDGLSAEAAIEISSPQQLAYIVANGGEGKYYKLTKDIYLNELSKIDWTTGEVTDTSYTPHEWYTGDATNTYAYDAAKTDMTFSGTIDGNGHTVYGLYYKPGQKGVVTGLIPVVDNATVTNLRLSTSFISGGRWTGTIAGVVAGSTKKLTVENVIVDSTVTAWGYNAGNAYYDGSTKSTDATKAASPFSGTPTTGTVHFESSAIGGLVAFLNSGATVNVSNSAVYAKLDGTGHNYYYANSYANGGEAYQVKDAGHITGLVGTMWNASGGINVSNVILSDMPCKTATNIIGSSTVLNFTNTYAVDPTLAVTIEGVNKITASDITGNAAKNTLAGFDFEGTWRATKTYPTLAAYFSEADAPEEEIVTGQIWSGETKEPTKGGDGSSADKAIEIATAEQLAYVIASGGNNLYYKLTADIILNDVAQIDWTTGAAAEGYTPNVWYYGTAANGLSYNGTANNITFTGTIDGNGHTVYGLYYPAGHANSSNGLIPATSGATVTNLRLANAYCVGGRWAGALVGASASGTLNVSKVVIADTVTVLSQNAGATLNNGTKFVSTGAAAVVAYTQSGASSVISDVISYAAASGSGNSNGIVGTMWNPTKVSITNSLSQLKPMNDGNGSYGSGDISCTNVYSLSASSRTGVTRIAKRSDIIGSGAVDILAGLDFESTWQACSYLLPTLKMFYSAAEDVNPDGDAVEPDRPVVWDGKTLTAPLGSGTKNDPYRIASAANLAYVLVNGSSADDYYIFINDILINDVDKMDWATGTPAEGYTPNKWYTSANTKPMSGHIDGNGKVVYGLYITGEASDRVDKYYTVGGGLFPSYDAVEIKDLGIDKAYMEHYTNYSFGAFLGYASAAEGSIDGCYVGKEVTLKGYDVGAFVGGGDLGTGRTLTISNCYSLATVNDSHRSGLIGDLWKAEQYTLNNCYAVGTKTRGNGNVNMSGIYVTDTSMGGTAITADGIKGTAAQEKMPNLDWENYFMTVEGDYPILQRFYKAATNEYWSGSSDVEPTTDADNDGFIDIGTPEELAWVVKNGGSGNYELTEDIYLNDLNAITWYSGDVTYGYTPKSWFTSDEVAPFSGTLKGNGHKIYGLYYKNTDTTVVNTGVGLFPNAGNGITINGLGIENAYLEHYSNFALGTFIGKLGNAVAGSVTESYVGESVTVKGYDAGAFIGGGTRDGASFTIENSYSLATVNFTHRGGLIGDCWTYEGNGNFIINKVYAAGSEIDNGVASDGIKIAVMQHAVVSATNTYAVKAFSGVTTKTLAEMQGMTALDNMPNLGDAFRATEGYPILAAFLPVVPPPTTGEVWDGETVTKPTLGSGTEEDPYLIHNAEELAWLATNGGEAGKHYKLVADILINSYNDINWTTGTIKDGAAITEINSWVTGGSFKAILDGDGHRVYGLYHNVAGDKTWASTGHALFVSSSGTAVIKNLGIDYAYVNGPNGAAAFVARNGATQLTISDSYVGANVTLNGNDAGAFVAVSDKTLVLNHVYNWGTTIGKAQSGLIGDTYNYKGEGACTSTVTNSYNATGAITSKHTISELTLTNNYVTAKGVGGADQLTAAEMQGLTVFNNGKPMQKLNTDKAWEATNGYPILDIFSETTGSDGEEYVPDTGIDANGIWTGTVLEAFSDDSAGTEDDPILISNPGELALAIKSNGSGKYYKLTADIYLNDVATRSWYTASGLNEWVKASNFKGHIDGDGYCVYGVYFPDDNTGYAGFICQMDSGSIKNLGVRYSYIQATDNKGVGGIIGYAAKGVITMDQCFVDETVTVKSVTTGGLVGLAQQGSAASTKGLVITNCYSKASIISSNTEKANGLIGNPWITAYEIYNSYAVGAKPYFANNAGGRSAMYWYHTTKKDEESGKYVVDVSEAKAGKNAADYFKNVYTDTGSPDGEHNIWTKVTNADMHGDTAKTAMSGLDYNNIWVTVAEGTPILRIFANRGLTGEDIDTSMDAEMFSKGSGKKSDPYLIETVEQLRYLVQSATTANKYYALANDIYINDTSKKNWMLNSPAEWYKDLSDSAFAGTFDGMGYEIHGIYIGETPANPDELADGANYVGGKAAGLFPYVKTSAVIRNVHIRNSYISGRGSVGAIAGHLTGGDSTAEFIGCSVDESVTVRGFTVGGLIGAGSATPVNIYFSYSTADLKNTGPDDRVNGLVGDIWGTKVNIMNSYVVGYRILRGSVGMTEAVYGDTHSSITTVVAHDSMYGDAAKKAMPDLNWDKVWYTVKGKTPQLKYVDYSTRPIENDEGVKGRVWSGKLATKFAGGTGTETDPYLIETPEQLAMLVIDGGKNDTYYKITADLKLNDTSKSGWEQKANEWFSGAGVFRGHLDGDGHVVTGLYINKTDAGYSGLFSSIGHSSSIKRLGVAASSVTNNALNSAHTYAGALLGSLENWDGGSGAGKDGVKTAPVISECFVAADVTVAGDTTGGLLGGGAAGIEFYNCYAVPTLIYSYRGGGIFGDLWEDDGEGLIIENCYVATADRDGVGMGPKATNQETVYQNVYVDGVGIASGKGEVLGTNLYYMKGDYAKDTFVGFDFSKIWKVVKNGTPVLRCFDNADKYTSTRTPKKVSIAFTTGADASQHEAIYGLPGIDKITEDMLPTPTRYGYKFLGWSYFDSGDLMFALDKFPMFDMYLYAVWEKLGFSQGFEGAMYPEYDVNAGAQYFKPGVAGYNPRYIHGGLRSMQTLAESEVAPIFLLNYEDKFEIGQKYEVTFWMTAKEDGQSGVIEFIHTNYPDVNDITVGYEEVVEFNNIRGGVWVQYSCTITANAPYILVKAPVGMELFFDDFEMVFMGEEGELGDLEGYNPDVLNAEPDTGLGLVWIIVIIAGGVVLLAGVAVLTIVLVKKGKKKGAQAPANESEAPDETSAE